MVDADFDDEERPDEDVHDESEEDDAPRRKRQVASGTYREPSARARKKPRVDPVKVDSQPVQGPVLTPQDSSAAPSPSAAVVEALQHHGPRVRSSTARKSSQSSELRRRASEEAARLAVKVKRVTVDKATTRLSQAELLREAVRTEVENAQSLNRLEQLEEEKKAEAATPKAPFTGEMVRYLSRVGAPKTITFLNTESFPSIFNQPKPKKRVATQVKLEQMRREAAEAAMSDGDEGSDNERTHADTSDEEEKNAAPRRRRSLPSSKVSVKVEASAS